MTHHTSLTEFILSCLVMLAITITAALWAHAAWLEHYT